MEVSAPGFRAEQGRVESESGVSGSGGGGQAEYN